MKYPLGEMWRRTLERERVRERWRAFEEGNWQEHEVRDSGKSDPTEEVVDLTWLLSVGR